MKVSINLVRETEYATVVEMEKSSFDRLKKDLTSEDRSARRNAEKEINRLVTEDDWQDDDLSRLDEFEETEAAP